MVVAVKAAKCQMRSISRLLVKHQWCVKEMTSPLIGMGSTMRMTMQAADKLSKAGVECQVVDVRSLAPLDEETLCAASAHTGRVVIVDESRDRCSAASHIAAILADRCFNSLRAPYQAGYNA